MNVFFDKKHVWGSYCYIGYLDERFYFFENNSSIKEHITALDYDNTAMGLDYPYETIDLKL